ncbi:MAG: tripartite tricarboxylate transporter substrate-binding protein, partial [Proteobacteria bacterium]|nr:tripartite tricarboxylate transporter substrate-binding protein [Pseudomonadota bacterium]
RVLATLLDKRSPVLPDVPTMPEANAPKLSIVPWAAFYGPPKLPSDIVSRVNRELNVVLARADVRELIDYIRANPGKLNYAGATTTGIMAAVQLAGFAKLDMVRVPYKGEGPASVDLIGGRVQLMFGTPTNTLGAAKEGKLRVLATLLDKRSPVLPDVPTMPEANAPKLSIVPWAAFYGPPKLPAEIVSRVNRELNVVLARADVRGLIERQVFDIQTSTPEELGAYTREQVESWKKAVADSGMPQE